MSSPFATTKEFMEAKGPIYTFANNSTVSSLFLLMSLAITIYFFYASYAMYKKNPSHASHNSIPMIGMLLVTGLATSLASVLMGTPKQPPATTSQRPVTVQQTQLPLLSQPIAVLLGLMGSASTVTGGAIRRQFGLRKQTSRSRRR